jgi:hypothetical protein
LKDATAEESGRGNTRNSRTRVGLIVLVYVLLISLALIIAVDFGPQLTEGYGFVAFYAILLSGIIFGTYWIVRKDLKYDTPRRVVILLIASGVAIVGAGFTTLIGMIVLLPPEARSPFFFLFLAMFTIGIGFVTAGLATSGSPSMGFQFQVPERLLNSLQQIDPDKSIETEKFHVFRKNGIYIMVQKRAWGIHFIRLFKQTSASTRKVDAPYLGLWGNLARSFKEEAYGLRLAKVRRKFTIPVDVAKFGDRTDTKYVSGPGILYYVPLFPMRWHRDIGYNLDGSWGYSHNVYEEATYFKVDTPTIIKILKELSEEKAKDASK